MNWYQKNLENRDIPQLETNEWRSQRENTTQKIPLAKFNKWLEQDLYGAENKVWRVLGKGTRELSTLRVKFTFN